MKEETPTFDFEILYDRYPRREGKQKGFLYLKRSVTTAAEYAAFERAIENYIALCIAEKRERQYIKIWSTFCNNWKDYVVIDAGPASSNLSQLQRIMQGDL